MKKVLLIGGTGTTGKYVIEFLNKYSSDIIQLEVASRNNIKTFRGIPHICMDLSNIKTIDAVITNYDIVIIVSGPFHEMDKYIYEICLLKGIHCYDINDDISHYSNLMKFIHDKNFSDVKGRIFTGIGMCPGLTTLLSIYLSEQINSDFLQNLQIRLFFGAGVSSGKSSISNMLKSINETPYVIKEGKQTMIRKKDFFSFNDYLKKELLVYFSSPEMFTLNKIPLFSKLQNFSIAFSIQEMSFMKLQIIKFISLFYKGRRWLEKKIYKQQSKLKNSIEKQIVIIYVKLKGNKEEIICSIEGKSSFELTAFFISYVIDYNLRNQILTNNILNTIEDLDLNVEDLILKLKNELNIKVDITR